MLRRTLTRRTKALVLWVAVYLVAFAVAAAVNTAADRGLRPAQHGAIEPAPTS